MSQALPGRIYAYVNSQANEILFFMVPPVARDVYIILARCEIDTGNYRESESPSTSRAIATLDGDFSLATEEQLMRLDAAHIPFPFPRSK